MGVNKVTGACVSIKDIPTAIYDSLTAEHCISEAESMTMLHKSKHVVKLVDHFNVNDITYIVSKEYAQAESNLLKYCLETTTEEPT